MRRLLNYLLFLGIAVFLLWIVYKDQDTAVLYQSILDVKLGWVVLATVILQLSNFSRAVRWNLMIKNAGYPTSSFKSYIALAVGYFSNAFIPRIGEVTRCTVISKVTKVPFSLLLGTVVSERIIDVIVLFAIITLDWVIDFEHMVDLIEQLFGTAATGGTSIYIWLAVGLIGFVVAAWVVYYLISKMPPWLKEIIKNVKQGLLSVWQLKKQPMKAFILHTIWIWVGYYLMIFCLFQSSDMVSHLGGVAVFTSLVLGSVGMTLPTPAGTGSYHLLTAGVLMAYGVSNSDAVTFAFIMHSSQVIAALVVGFISFLMIPLLKKQVNKQLGNEQPVSK